MRVKNKLAFRYGWIVADASRGLLAICRCSKVR
jgi:hypothetical protein